ncbi:LysR family transcriptional regulator [Cognatishimia sp. SS12]|uniref:LysR family transcriptional regulator n=1 Tax=Cognatishimia sp. SS12 TaxID=2979465 RepID=UPI0023314065|nr:LysR family transcriptional regulator [Cognatishimia sp. SS12]MDC0739331.1 LysR family transcriptional regulator [Cognatishimia sp. SS12]
MVKRHNLNRLAHFIAVVETGSITGAAEALAISKAVVSKQLKTLEEELGVSLLVRNSRHMVPTDAGLAFYERCKSIVAQANEAFETIASGAEVPSGKLRITAPVDLGMTQITPLVADFAKSYPAVELDLYLSDDRLDPVSHRFDIAFRVGWLEDSSNVARKMFDFAETIVAAPALAQKLNVTHPRDLAKVAFVANRALADPYRWQFTGPEGRCSVTLRSGLIMNVGPALRSAVEQGAGVAILPDYLVQEGLDSGTLVRLLPDWTLRAGGVYAVFPPVKFRQRAVELFLQAALKHFKS